MKITRQQAIVHRNIEYASEILRKAHNLRYTGVVFRIIDQSIELYIYTTKDVEDEIWDIHYQSEDKDDDNYIGFEFEDGIALPVIMDNEKPKTIEYSMFGPEVFELPQN